MSEEKKDRKPRESNPWHVYTVDAGGHAEICQAVGPFEDLAAAEKSARALAVKEQGTTFAPVKIGKAFKAEKVESVRVSRG